MKEKIENLKSGVYFIYAPNQNKIKIGRSVNIDVRYKQLRTGFMDTGSLLLGILSENEVSLERDLHDKFAHLRANGEWFYMTKELDDFILSCKNTYANVKEYQDLEVIQKKLSFNSLGMYRFVLRVKNIQNRYLVPCILALIGSLIAYYNFQLTGQDRIGSIIEAYSFFIFFPILIPLLAKRIIKYSSILECLIFFGVLLFIFSVEIWNILFLITPFVMKILRIIELALIVTLTTNFSIIIWKNQSEETMRTEIKLELRRQISIEPNLSKVISLRNQVITKDNDLSRLGKWVLLVAGLVKYVLLAIFFLSSKPDLVFKVKFGLLIMIGCSAMINLLAFVFLIKKINTKFSEIAYKISNLVALCSSFLINFIIFSVGSYNVIFIVISILMVELIPVIIASVYITSKKKRYAILISEIHDILRQCVRQL